MVAMSEYTERSRVLARALAEKAAGNLRRSGHTVTRDESTGEYTVTRAGASRASSQSGSSDERVTHRSSRIGRSNPLRGRRDV